MPFENNTFDAIYSCSTIQHIEEHAMFHLFSELVRVMKPDARAFLHVTAWKDAFLEKDYLELCRKVVRGDATHWHVFYAREELEMKMGWLDVRDLRIDPFWEDGLSYRVTFTK